MTLNKTAIIAAGLATSISLATTTLAVKPQMIQMRASSATLTKSPNDKNVYSLTLKGLYSSAKAYSEGTSSTINTRNFLSTWMNHNNDVIGYDGKVLVALELVSAYGLRFQFIELSYPNLKGKSTVVFHAQKPDKVKYFLTGKFRNVVILAYPDPCNVSCNLGIWAPQWAKGGNNCWPGNSCKIAEN